MKEDSSAIARFAIAIKQVWDEATRAEALRLHRPWEAEGELRWIRDPGGHRLVGQALPARRVPLPRRLALRARIARRSPRSRQPEQRPPVLRG